MNPEFDALKKEVEALRRIVDSMQSPVTVSPEFNQVLSSSTLSASSKGASSENQAVNEAGVSSYNVLGTPDGFDERNDGGTTKYYPYYT